jgi:S-formylglutathione hydrolase FrmB
MTSMSRRTVLRLAAGAAVGMTLPPLLTRAWAEAAPPPAGPDSAAPAAAEQLSGSFVSAARGGVETRWIIARPAGVTGPMRTVIALHGKDADAATVMGYGVEAALAQVVRAGGAPLAVVAVDGGNGYWHPRAAGGDAGAMVLDELLPMLADKGLDTSRVAFLGWSMGGYGALLLGGMLGPARTSAVCAVSPALYTSWLTAMANGAADGPDDWAKYSVFGADALSAIPVRVDCGTSDRFYAVSQKFAASLRRPPAGVAYAGGHDPEVWRQQLPAELAWLAAQQ